MQSPCATRSRVDPVDNVVALEKCYSMVCTWFHHQRILSELWSRKYRRTYTKQCFFACADFCERSVFEMWSWYHSIRHNFLDWSMPCEANMDALLQEKRPWAAASSLFAHVLCALFWCNLSICFDTIGYPNTLTLRIVYVANIEHFSLSEHIYTFWTALIIFHGNTVLNKIL